MINWRYHFLFWLIYLSYISATVYMINMADFLFPTTIIDIFVGNIVTSILPFYGFYYAIILFLEKHRRWQAILLFIGVIAMVVAVEYWGYQPFQNLLYGEHRDYGLVYILGISLSNDIKVFIFCIAFYYLTRTRTAQQELLTIQKEKLELEQKKLQAEVAYLKAQINPHFLQNVLNFFYAQALPKSDKLAEAILLLSDIMRYAMDKNEDEKGEVRLSNEVSFIKKYIKINQLRYQGKIAIELDIAGDDLSALRIIPMVLITLVENAFKHGELLLPQWPVKIFISYTAASGLFTFSVSNKIKKGPKEISNGIGLENIRERLQMAYGNNALLTFDIDADTEVYQTVLAVKY